MPSSSRSATAAATDNRANQLNPQNPVYYLSRGLTAVAAAAAAAVTTVRNQDQAAKK